MYTSESHEVFTELTRIVFAQNHARDMKAEARRHASSKLPGIAPATSAMHMFIATGLLGLWVLYSLS